jgi:hypothetical protein
MRFSNGDVSLNWRWGLFIVVMVSALLFFGRYVQLPPGLY